MGKIGAMGAAIRDAEFFGAMFTPGANGTKLFHTH
jgi:hypothetical protein